MKRNFTVIGWSRCRKSPHITLNGEYEASCNLTEEGEFDPDREDQYHMGNFVIDHGDQKSVQNVSIAHMHQSQRRS